VARVKKDAICTSTNKTGKKSIDTVFLQFVHIIIEVLVLEAQAKGLSIIENN